MCYVKGVTDLRRILEQVGAVPLALLHRVPFLFDFILKEPVAIAGVKNLLYFLFVVCTRSYVRCIILYLD